MGPMSRPASHPPRPAVPTRRLVATCVGRAVTASLALALALAVPSLPAQEVPGEGPQVTNTPSMDTGIRKRLRGLRFIRNQLLERAITRRYAMRGKLALLLADSPDELDELIPLARSYEKIVTELRAIPVAEYHADPGTAEALERAIGWGIDHALAVPHYHRLGYVKIERILVR